VTLTLTSFKPVARRNDLERLEALPPGSALTPELWTKVHDEIQRHLAPLETEVRRIVPGTRVRAGRTSGLHFFLFSYRTFFLPDTAFDPVVVGMTFTSVDQGVTVEADISGEHTGDCISSLTTKTVVDSRKELLAVACESAQNLCQSAREIAAALTDPSRSVE
jgi:hypothetical protein